jgi:hypothetical protein
MPRTHPYSENCSCPACEHQRGAEDRAWEERQRKWRERLEQDVPGAPPKKPAVYETDASGSVLKTCRCGTLYELFDGGRVTYRIWARILVTDKDGTTRLVTIPLHRKQDGCPVCMDLFNDAVVHGNDAIPCPVQKAAQRARRPAQFSERVRRIL